VRFLLREGDVDLLRTTTDEVDGGTLLKAPSEPFKLVVKCSCRRDPASTMSGKVATAEGLRDISLLGQMEVVVQAGEDCINLIPHFLLHPATAQFITDAHSADPDLLHGAHHLFEAGDYDRAYELLGVASDWLQSRGWVREGLKLLEPFLTSGVRSKL
jgi:hypothetical protein